MNPTDGRRVEAAPLHGLNDTHGIIYNTFNIILWYYFLLLFCGNDDSSSDDSIINITLVWTLIMKVILIIQIQIWELLKVVDLT